MSGPRAARGQRRRSPSSGRSGAGHHAELPVRSAARRPGVAVGIGRGRARWRGRCPPPMPPPRPPTGRPAWPARPGRRGPPSATCRPSTACGAWPRPGWCCSTPRCRGCGAASWPSPPSSPSRGSCSPRCWWPSTAATAACRPGPSGDGASAACSPPPSPPSPSWPPSPRGWPPPSSWRPCGATPSPPCCTWPTGASSSRDGPTPTCSPTPPPCSTSGRCRWRSRSS